jgi:hypothetical protein
MPSETHVDVFSALVSHPCTRHVFNEKMSSGGQSAPLVPQKKLSSSFLSKKSLQKM